MNEPGAPQLNRKPAEDAYFSEGKPKIDKPSMQKIQGLQDMRKDYHFRKRELFKIIDFLIGSKKELVVNGPPNIGKHCYISKAIQFIAEHQKEAVEDGAYCIDLEGMTNIRQLYQEIDSVLDLHLKEMTESYLIKCKFIQTKKTTLVFNKIPKDNAKLLNEIFHFLRKVCESTQNIKVIMVLELSSQEISKKKLDLQMPEIEVCNMEYLNEDEAVEFLNRVLLVENKRGLIKKDITTKDKIMQIWGSMNFIDDYAFQIVSMLDKRTNLDKIANLIEQFVQNKEEDNTLERRDTSHQILVKCYSIVYQLKQFLPREMAKQKTGLL